MLISGSTEHFNKTQMQFLIKLSNTKNRGYRLQKFKASLLSLSRSEARIYSFDPFSQCTRNSILQKRQGKDTIDIQRRKEEIKWPLFTNGIIINVENPKK